MTTEELENYEPKGELEGFPKEIVKRMLECQKEQGNDKDVSVFERDAIACDYSNGFRWVNTKEGYKFWQTIIVNKNFDLFFKKYPSKLILPTELEKGKVFNEKTKMFEVPAPQRVTIVYNYIFVNTTK